MEKVLYFGIVYASDLYACGQTEDNDDRQKMSREPQQMKKCPECHILYSIPVEQEDSDILTAMKKDCYNENEKIRYFDHYEGSLS